jgi:(p)ppGpp synthase/HD superfamily hydrolase
MEQVMLSKMLSMAAFFHASAYDKHGKPYFLHVCTVMHKLRSTDEELNCIAVGHDLLEDTSVTAEMLRQDGFTERVIFGIECLTKVKGESPEEYLAKVLSNRDSCLVKLSDLQHNMDPRRIKGLRPKDIQRTIKYQEMYLTILQHVQTAYGWSL